VSRDLETKILSSENSPTYKKGIRMLQRDCCSDMLNLS
jgi:hypothetical protein